MYNILDNLDLLVIGLATVSTGILGFSIYFNNIKSTTNKLFLLFTLITIVWGFAGYISSHPTSANVVLWSARAVMFFAVWQALSLFLLFYVFPNDKLNFKKRSLYLLVIFAIGISILTLTPIYFKEVSHFEKGLIPKISAGPGLIAFATYSVSLVIAGLGSFFRTTILTPKDKRRPFFLIWYGVLLTFLLIICLNFILPTFFNDYRFLPFGSMFTLPFIMFTGYAIAKHKIFNIKVFSSEIFIFILLAISFLEFINTKTLLEFILRFFIFFSLSLFSILLIKGVVLEVKQKERFIELAKSLEIANIQLKELDRQKTDFLSIAAHQLRTPLSIMNGYVELLRDGAYGVITPEQKDVYKNIDESNGHLVKLVDSFLDISRLEQGRTKYDFISNDLNDLIDSVVKELEPKAKTKEIKLVWSREPGLAKIIFDVEKIRHVVLNYIDNSIKYSEKGEVKIDAVKDGAGISFRVRDNGIGFEKVDEVNFFQKFYRGNNVQGMNVNGTGLGLYVCSKFIEAHHGKVWGKSLGIGKGSEFGFWIPAHQA